MFSTARIVAVLVATPLLIVPLNQASAAAAPKVTVSRHSDGGFTVKWTKVAGATSYKLYRETQPKKSGNDQGYIPPSSSLAHIKTVKASVTSTRTEDYYEPELSVFAYSMKFEVRAYKNSKLLSRGAGRAGCASGYFLSLRGSGQNPSGDKDNGYAKGMGAQGSRVYNDVRLRLKLRWSTLQPVSIAYSAAHAGWSTVGGTYGKSKDGGKMVLLDTVKTIHKQCPDKPLLIFGFSQGAHAAGDAFNSYPASAKKKIVHQVLFADPMRNMDDPKVLALPNYLKGGGILGKRKNLTGTTAAQNSQWCSVADSICYSKGPRLPAHASANDCYEKWAARMMAVRAKNTKWRPSANTANPSCKMQK